MTSIDTLLPGDRVRVQLNPTWGSDVIEAEVVSTDLVARQVRVQLPDRQGLSVFGASGQEITEIPMMDSPVLLLG